MNIERPPLGDELMPYLAIPRAAFPSAPTGEERRAVLAVLLSDMSDRQMAALAAEFFDGERVVLLGEAIHAATDMPVDRELKSAARHRLQAAGWDFSDED